MFTSLPTPDAYRSIPFNLFKEWKRPLCLWGLNLSEEIRFPHWKMNIWVWQDEWIVGMLQFETTLGNIRRNECNGFYSIVLWYFTNIDHSFGNFHRWGFVDWGGLSSLISGIWKSILASIIQVSVHYWLLISRIYSQKVYWLL